MIKFTVDTFPFVYELHKSGGHVNDVCRDEDRTKEEVHCPFVSLSAFSFSNAMILALLGDFVEDLLFLNKHLDPVLRHLEEISRLNETHKLKMSEDIKRCANAALGRARRLQRTTRVLDIDHAFVELFLEWIDENSENVQGESMVDDIKLRFREVMIQLAAVGSPGYPRKDFSEPENNLKILYEQSKPFKKWLDGSRDLRIGVGKYVWDCRERHMKALEIEEDAKGKEKQQGLEQVLTQRIISMVKDKDCVFSSKVDVNGEEKGQ